jgi:hypothetical protein
LLLDVSLLGEDEAAGLEDIESFCDGWKLFTNRSRCRPKTKEGRKPVRAVAECSAHKDETARTQDAPKLTGTRVMIPNVVPDVR